MSTTYNFKMANDKPEIFIDMFYFSTDLVLAMPEFIIQCFLKFLQNFLCKYCAVNLVSICKKIVLKCHYQKMGLPLKKLG